MTQRLPKLLVLAGIILWLQGTLHAQADFAFKKLTPYFGSADRWGYAMWTEPLAEVTLNGSKVPLHLVFSTDPRYPVGSLGQGWKLPFFESSLVEEKQTTLLWLRPDTVTTRFTSQRGETAQPGNKNQEVFTSMDGGWEAVRTKGSREVVLTHAKSGAELVYNEGLLVRFCFVKPGQGVERYTISYNRLRKPLRLSAMSSGRPVVEFVYESERLTKELRLELGIIAFSYTDADLNRFASGPYLSGVSSKGLPATSSSAVVSFSPLAIAYRSEGTAANGVRFAKLTDGGGNTGLVWDSATGFLREDDGASYKIENPSLANGGRPVVDPKDKAQAGDKKVAGYNWRADEAKMTRKDREGKSEFLHYDRSRGVFTRTNKEGLTTKTYYLLTPGPMMNKVRKIEEIRNGKIEVLQRNAYDDQGRRLRRIDSDGSATIWERNQIGGSAELVREIRNGIIVREFIYKDQEIVIRRIYKESGAVIIKSEAAIRKLGISDSDALLSYFSK